MTTPPVLQTPAALAYPAEAFRIELNRTALTPALTMQTIGGRVVLKVLVQADGTVRRVRSLIPLYNDLKVAVQADPKAPAGPATRSVIRKLAEQAKNAAHDKRAAEIVYEMVGRLTERWALSANLTWTDGLNRVSGQPLLRVAPIQANLVLRCAWEENRTLSLVGNYVSARPDIGGVTVAAYTMFGSRYDQPLGDVTARVGVDNLFDTSYETLSGYPGPRRTVYVQLGREF